MCFSVGMEFPGAIVFGCNVFLDMPLITDLLAIGHNCQLLVDKRLVRANAKHIKHDCVVGDEAWKCECIGLSDKTQACGLWGSLSSCSSVHQPKEPH